ncbi:MAG: hypothetical protein FAF03_08575 [Epsilonproteobacteria bacterium]|nr:hypothetical protein [Campylobacterota bacterium]
MVAYENDELIPSSEFAKKFGMYLSQIKDHTVDKLAVLKNNRIEAVVVSKDEYEKMQKAYEEMEDMYIAKIVEERSKLPREEYISMEEMAKKLGVDLDAL